MKTQRDANYVDHPVAGQRCDACTMYRNPNRCSLVTGRILPDGHCAYWEPKIVKSFNQIMKGEPSGPTDVHVATALGNQRPQRRRYRPFVSFVSGGPKKPQDGPSTFGPMPVITATTKSFKDIFRDSFGYDVDTGEILKRSPIVERLRRLEARNPAVKPTRDLNVTPTVTATSKRYATTADLPKTVRDRYKGSPKKLRQWMHVWNSEYDDHGKEDRAFASAWAAVQKSDDVTVNVPLLIRLLEYAREEAPDDMALHRVAERVIANAAGGKAIGMDAYRHLVKRLTAPTAPPFQTDLGFMSRLHGPQVPSFLWALTHRDKLPKAKVPMDSLVAIQDRIDPADVARDEEEPPTQRPTIVRHNGVNYIADGHDRLSARLLGGKKNANVRLHDLDHPSDPEAVKKWDEARSPTWEIPLEIKKVDPDQRMIFGWASIVTKDGRLVVDHQNDVISADELEKAFYDYVLYERGQGHMHSQMGVGRLIECMMFTKQKQDVLKIVVRDEDGDQIEGAWVGYFVDDNDVWAAHKRHELPAFSIGGSAVPIEVEI